MTPVKRVDDKNDPLDIQFTFILFADL